MQAGAGVRRQVWAGAAGRQPPTSPSRDSSPSTSGRQQQHRLPRQATARPLLTRFSKKLLDAALIELLEQLDELVGRVCAAARSALRSATRLRSICAAASAMTSAETVALSMASPCRPLAEAASWSSQATAMGRLRGAARLPRRDAAGGTPPGAQPGGPPARPALRGQRGSVGERRRPTAAHPPLTMRRVDAGCIAHGGRGCGGGERGEFGNTGWAGAGDAAAAGVAGCAVEKISLRRRSIRPDTASPCPRAHLCLPCPPSAQRLRRAPLTCSPTRPWGSAALRGAAPPGRPRMPGARVPAAPRPGSGSSGLPAPLAGAAAARRAVTGRPGHVCARGCSSGPALAAWQGVGGV